MNSSAYRARAQPGSNATDSAIRARAHQNGGRCHVAVAGMSRPLAQRRRREALRSTGTNASGRGAGFVDTLTGEAVVPARRTARAARVDVLPLRLQPTVGLQPGE